MVFVLREKNVSSEIMNNKVPNYSQGNLSGEEAFESAFGDIDE